VIQPTLKRSKLYQSQFQDELMLKAFGTLTPDVGARTVYFFDLWMDWRVHRVRLKRNSMHSVRKMLKEAGFLEMWEYQIREGEVRFCNPDILAMAVLYGIDTYKEERERV
jgi:hypothetical protein